MSDILTSNYPDTIPVEYEDFDTQPVDVEEVGQGNRIQVLTPLEQAAEQTKKSILQRIIGKVLKQEEPPKERIIGTVFGQEAGRIMIQPDNGAPVQSIDMHGYGVEFLAAPEVIGPAEVVAILAHDTDRLRQIIESRAQVAAA